MLSITGNRFQDWISYHFAFVLPERLFRMFNAEMPLLERIRRIPSGTTLSWQYSLSFSTLSLSLSLSAGTEVMSELHGRVELALRHYCPLTPSLVSISFYS
jgi:hypothetical protein